MSQAILGGLLATAVAGSIFLEKSGMIQTGLKVRSQGMNPNDIGPVLPEAVIQPEVYEAAANVMLVAESMLPDDEARDAYWGFLMELAATNNLSSIEAELKTVLASKKASAPDMPSDEPEFSINIENSWSGFTEVPALPDVSGAVPEEQEAITIAIEEEYARLKKPVMVSEICEGWGFDRYVVNPTGSHSRRTLCENGVDIQAKLGLAKPPLVSTTPAGVGVDIPRHDRRWPKLQDYLDTMPDTPGFWLPFGVTVEGTAQWVDLSDPSSSHVLIAGTSGSGKSVLEMALLEAIEAIYPDRVKVCAIDPKEGVEIKHWNQSVVQHRATTPLGAVEILRAVNRRRKDISARMAERGWRDWSENPNGKRLVYLCDEFAQLSCPGVTEDKLADAAAAALSKEFNSLVDEISRLGRSAGIHLILCTQSPRKEVITPSIRDNISVRCCLLVASKEISGVILSENGSPRGQHLLGKGDMILKVAGSIDTRIQSFNPF